MRLFNSNYFLALLLLLSFSTRNSSYAQRTDWYWVIDNPGGSPVYARAFLKDMDQNLWICGEAWDSINANPDPAGTPVDIPGEGAHVIKLDSSRNLLWARTFQAMTSVSGAYLNGSLLDDAGNLLIAGHYYGSMNFNPDTTAPVIMVADTSLPYSSIYITKFNSSGNLLWAKTIGSPGVHESAIDITTDSGGNIYLTGKIYGTTDLNPSPTADFIVTPFVSPEGFILKLDAMGNFIWARLTRTAKPEGLLRSPDGDLLLYGYTTGTEDLDFSPASSWNYTSIGLNDFFLVRMDTSGAMIWAKTIGSTGDEDGWRVTTDPSGNYYLAGSTLGDPDWNPDPSPGASLYLPWAWPGSNRTGIVKLDASGNFAWAKQLVADGSIELSSISADAQGNVHAAGSFFGLADLDPDDLFTVPAYAFPNTDGYIVSLDALGNYRNSSLLKGMFTGNILTVMAESDGACWFSTAHSDSSVFISGTDTIPLSTDGTWDCMIGHLAADSCNYLQIEIDSVSNASCSGPGYISVAPVTGYPPYTYEWSTTSADSFIEPPTAGIYVVTVTDSNACTYRRGVIMGGPSTVSGFDLKINLAATPLRPGIPGTVWVDAYNSGCIPITGTAYMVLDPAVTLISAVPPPVSISGDTLTWVISGLVFDGPHFLAELNILPDSSLSAGDTLCLSAWIDPASGDDNPYDNFRYDACIRVINSYDPNDKQVYPNGVCAEHYVEKGTPLTYTIRFQNTGTAEALKVVILDTLSQHLDVQSLTVHGHSHPMHTELVSGNIVRFVFNNIHLPDSTTDEPGSHGYVIFEISPESGLASGTIVTNSSGIYFDFNDPVITNTVYNTYVDSIPACSTVQMEEAYSEQVRIALAPNPAADMLRISATEPILSVSITDCRGVQVLAEHLMVKPSLEITCKTSGLPQGIYFVRVETAAGVAVSRLAVVRE